MVIRKRLPLTGSAMVFVTTTVRNWQPIFRNDRAAKLVALQMQETSSYYRTEIVGWVIMPTHVHALLGFAQIENMSRLMQSFKSLTARRLAAEGLSDARLWQPRFDDVIVWSEEQFRVKLSYIHNNPVKAGLVEDACTYRWSSARDWLLDEAGEIPVSKNWSWT